MISRNRVHSEVLKVINETCTGMNPIARTRLAVAIAKGLHPVIVEQILREIESAKEADHGRPAADHAGSVPSDTRAHVSGVPRAGDRLTGADR